MVPVDTTVTSAAMPIMTAQTDTLQADSFMDESRRQRKPRTSDPNFNQEKTNLIVNYLPQNFTDQEFFNLFSTVGKCNKARIIRHRQTGYSYGYGFIDMGSPADAEKAIKKLNQYQIGHKRLKVAYSLPSGERTRNINLYIKGLPKTWTKRDLENKFRAFGDIRNARILLDPATQMGTGVGFLLYATRNEAEKACQLMNGESIEGGEPLQISFARSQSQPPVEWVIAGQPGMIQPTQIGQIAAFGGIVPQPSAYKGRRYNPIAGKSSLVQQQQQQQPQNQRQMVFQNQIPQQMIMVPAFNTMPYAQQLQNQQLETIQVVQPTTVQNSTSPQQQQQQPQLHQQQQPATSVKQTVQTVASPQPVIATTIQQVANGQTASTPVTQHQQVQQQQQQQQVQSVQQVPQTQQMMMPQMMPANITLAQAAQTQLIQPTQQAYQQVASRGYFSTGVM